MSATVVPNCTTTASRVTCTKGVTPPKTVTGIVLDGNASVEARRSASLTSDYTRTITVTVNY